MGKVKLSMHHFGLDKRLILCYNGSLNSTGIKASNKRFSGRFSSLIGHKRPANGRVNFAGASSAGIEGSHEERQDCTCFYYGDLDCGVCQGGERAELSACRGGHGRRGPYARY